MLFGIILKAKMITVHSLTNQRRAAKRRDPYLHVRAHQWYVYSLVLVSLAVWFWQCHFCVP